MKLLFALFLTINSVIANSQCCEFDKDCFAIFIRVLYNAEALDREDKIFQIHLADEKFKTFFTKKVDTGDKNVCLKMADVKAKNSKLLVINSIQKVDSTEYIVHFNSRYNGTRFMGRVHIGFENEKPVFIKKFIIEAID